ncbi:MAG: hypothetical protein ABSH50_21035 [Bryobacteraceae bacterium]|jgi:hypothetical protein
MPSSAAIRAWLTPSNAVFVREGRCLRFAAFSQSLRDCTGCRTIARCNFYDWAGVRDRGQLDLARWEDDGGTSPVKR